MLEKVAKTIKDHNLIKPGDKIVLGISGGPDSVCLLDILIKLKYDLVLAHVNYNLRGEDSIKEIYNEIKNEKKLNENYNLYFKKYENQKPKIDNRDLTATSIMDYRFFSKIKNMKKDGIIAIEKDVLKVNQKMKNTIKLFVKFLKDTKIK